jgi:hypothetical protein
MIAMTQDQYSQGRGSGYVERGDMVPEEETGESRSEQSRPMTRFQKVASVLRGSEPDEYDRAEADQAEADRVAAEQASADRSKAGSPISRETEPERDYWDEPGTSAEGEEEPVAVTRPEVPGQATGTADHAATEPDMFGTTGRTGDETAPMPEVSRDSRGSRDQAGTATIADVPAAGTTAADVPAGGAAADDVAAADAAEAGATGAGTGRHTAARAARAATPAAGDELRPGEAAGTLGDFSDLTYGNLIPDTAVYTEQWQQVQFKFVDDPRASVTEAADIVAQVTTKLESAIQERQRAIEERQHAITEQQRSLRGRWGEGTNADTETLRETLRMYKTFLDQLIGTRTG